MADFTAEGTLLIESIENNAADDLEDEFSVSASDAISAGSGGRSRTTKRITANLDETVDLAETRNDLLRDIQETTEDGSFRISRGLRSLSRASVGAALGGGALVTAALSQSPDTRPQPDETGDPNSQPDPNTGESDIVDPVTITASQVIASGASVPVGAVISSAAAITASEVIGDAAGVGSEDVVEGAAELGASDVVDAAVELATGDVVAAGVELGKSDVLAGAASGAAVELGAGDLVDPVELKASDVIDANIGVEEILGTLAGVGAGGGLLKALSGGGSSAGASGVGAGVGPPISIIPQLADTLNDVTPRDIIPGPDRDRRRARDRRGVNVEVSNNVETNQTLDRREKKDIISEAIREMRRELRNEID